MWHPCSLSPRHICHFNGDALTVFSKPPIVDMAIIFPDERDFLVGEMGPCGKRKV
jgi:hypothetical protein